MGTEQKVCRHYRRVAVCFESRFLTAFSPAPGYCRCRAPFKAPVPATRGLAFSIEDGQARLQRRVMGNLQSSVSPQRAIAMLRQLVLQNYRGFRQHTVPFRHRSIIIGRNNAGKSTIVEALRLLSIVVNRFQHSTYINMFRETRIPELESCIAPSLRGTYIDLRHVCYQYGDPPAILEATFSGNQQVSIYLFPENELFAVIKDEHGRAVESKSRARFVSIPQINVLPQVRPFLVDEEPRDEAYVKSSIMTDLSPLHFRNQLRIFAHLYDNFARLAEESWPGLRIRDLDLERTEEGVRLSQLVQDGRFVAEVGRMGHGLQIWLQVIWFLTRSDNLQTLILDEPDVYLHADLQRRLVRNLVTRPNQIILTSHSVEILSEISPDQILIVDKTRTSSTFATSVPAVQSIVDHIGSIHNVQLARLWDARRFLLVEGKDLYLLKIFHGVLFPRSKNPIDAIPNMAVGGWGGWNYAVGSSMLLRNSVGEEVVTYCVLDSDYHTNDEIEERLRDATMKGVELHIWRRKEIENYVIVPEAIVRAVRSLAPGVGDIISDQIAQQIDGIADDLRTEIIELIAEHNHQRNRAVGLRTQMQRAREFVAQQWGSFDGRVSLLPGKRAMGQLAEWIRRELGVSLSPRAVALAMRRDEIATEVRGVLEAIERGRRFGQ
jgi:AAA domain, putative AbiEii toxin, Type IV TA system/AAA domain